MKKEGGKDQHNCFVGFLRKGGVIVFIGTRGEGGKKKEGGKLFFFLA